jgi:ACS family D-galactonate transporter-like MFS transporter
MPSFQTDSRRFGAFAPALALLAIAVLINYVDRGNLSIAAPLVKEELHLSAFRLGLLFSAFFYTYTAFIFVSGWLVDRFNVNLVLAGGFLVWSLATAATGLARSFAVLFAFRLLLGIGESVAFPSISKILARHVCEVHRGFANGLVSCGMNAGPAVGTLGAGFLIVAFGWRYVFLGIGLISLLWIPAWLKWMPRTPVARSETATAPSTGVLEIVLQRSFWGTTLGHFCGNYALYFMITWLPIYLKEERHLSMQQTVEVASLYYAVVSLVALGTGWLTDSFIRRGSGRTVVRKSAMACGLLLVAFALTACAFAGPHTYLLALFIGASGGGIAGSGVFVFPQILAGPAVAGRWVGLQNGFANFSGVIGPALTGFLVGKTGNYVSALVVTALVSVAGALCYTLVVAELEPVQWTAAPTTSASVIVEPGLP